MIAAAVGGCIVADQDAEGDDTSEAAIFGGTRDNDESAIPGVVAIKLTKTATKFELCSGALVAPNLVLTARHCVANVLTDDVSCDVHGLPTNGPHVAGDQDPTRLSIFTGANPSLGQEPSALATEVISPKVDYLCDNDIAFVVLDRDITDVTPLAVRTAGTVYQGETIRSVGYGQNDKSQPLGTRFRRENVSVLALGNGMTHSKTALGPREFEVGRSICQGDSGGPAISEETSAVIGVVSRGGNCTDNFGHIYTSTYGFDELFAEAFEHASTPPLADIGVPNGVLRAPGDQLPVPEVVPTAKPKTGGQGCGASRGAADGGGLALALGVGLVLRYRRRRSAR